MPTDSWATAQQHSVSSEQNSDSHVIAWTQPGPSRQAPFSRSHHACCLTDENEIVLHGGWTGVKLVRVFPRIFFAIHSERAHIQSAQLYLEIRLHLRNMVSFVPTQFFLSIMEYRFYFGLTIRYQDENRYQRPAAIWYIAFPYFRLHFPGLILNFTRIVSGRFGHTLTWCPTIKTILLIGGVRLDTFSPLPF